ncbi:hypothetical protein [Pseudobacteriovorax antillogorgiicola]|uniref:Uncharacterized protein n=1 Tax=Pseudobacteriovorax antillogorgiicola TaxID=1513793 RepID=A0A1Y6C5Y3_9BACT|nr:hypothetical protein [Pseudobacteriovorax antillogorgiicola]TCS51171.1 hypothetical protein EDD56_11154 [Pseudobacteriovorax antillogorgiicola]SMF38037.1 hypothetical protein SAMN06296036_111124 [Pseudobacteriovorax antillogorgiicola]
MAIQFNRKPYKVTYYKDGERKTIRRVPPPKLHDMLPKDKVSLTRGKNDDFETGDEFTVKHINQRHPNVLQVTNDDGRSTFIDYYDLKLEQKIAKRNGVDPLDFPENNRYLRWP